MYPPGSRKLKRINEDEDEEGEAESEESSSLDELISGVSSEDIWNLKVETRYAGGQPGELTTRTQRLTASSFARLLRELWPTLACGSSSSRLLDHPNLPFRGSGERIVPSALAESLLPSHPRSVPDVFGLVSIRDSSSWSGLNIEEVTTASLQACPHVGFHLSEACWHVVGFEIPLHGFGPKIDGHSYFFVPEKIFESWGEFEGEDTRNFCFRRSSVGPRDVGMQLLYPSFET